MKLPAVCLAIVAVLHVSLAANVLFLSGIPSPSHFFWLRSLINGMADRGHNVTVISTNVDPKHPPNVSYLLLENFYQAMYNNTLVKEIDFFKISEAGPLNMLHQMDEFGIVLCEAALKSQGFNDLMNYPTDFKFDLFLSDYMIGPCIPSMIMHRFNNPPYIPSAPYNAPSTSGPLLGSYSYSGLVPNHFFDAPEEMSFVDRVRNFFYDHYEIISKDLYLYPESDKIIQRVFPGAPSAKEIQKNIRLSLININPVIQYKEPLMPNLIPVGGLQIQPPQPLPTDLRDVIDGAPNGFILFSLGSNARSDLLGVERITNILNAMGRVPQYQFLWKFESDVLNLPVTVPKNVHIRSWMPQNDLLAHPNIKLFITHSGLLSTQEAIWNGVPIIGFPLFADQFRNINYCVKAGIGKRLSINYFNPDEFVKAVTDILSDGQYNVRMKRISHLFRDQPESPLERAVWWCEWVLRNPDADIMQSSAANMSWFRKYSYDVLSFVFVVLALAAIAVRRTLLLVRKLFQGASNKNKRD